MSKLLQITIFLFLFSVFLTRQQVVYSACNPDCNLGGSRCGNSCCCTDSPYDPCIAQPRTCVPAEGGGSCTPPAPACDAKFACGDKACWASAACQNGI